MTPENIAHAARVNAAAHLIRDASKIARRLVGLTREQQQAIEDEIVVIAVRLYSETTQEEEPETTHDPGEDHELVEYVAAVRELDSFVEWWFAQNDYQHGFSVEKSAERWREFEAYAKGPKGDE